MLSRPQWVNAFFVVLKPIVTQRIIELSYSRSNYQLSYHIHDVYDYMSNEVIQIYYCELQTANIHILCTTLCFKTKFKFLKFDYWHLNWNFPVNICCKVMLRLGNLARFKFAEKSVWSSQRMLWHGPLTRYVNLRVAHAPGMPGTFSPPPRVCDPDMHHSTSLTHVPRCMSGSLTIGFY